MMHHHHHHSPALKTFGMISWLVTSLSALAVGLAALGHHMGKSWDIWQSEFVMSHLSSLVQPAQYLIGICGLFSLICYFMCMSSGDHKK